MNAPRVSVILPVCNAERFVGAALESIRAQTFCDFECVVIDDGSRDASLDIIRAHAAEDHRLRVISRPNRGLVATLNEGLGLARGELVARMDADDRCTPDRFEKQVRRVDEEPELVALGSCALAIDPEGRRLGPAPVPLTHEGIETKHLNGESCIYHSAVMMRAAAVRGVGGYRDLCPVEDFDLWLRLGEVGRLGNLPEELLIWRRTRGGLVASMADRWQRAIERALTDAWRRRGLPGQPPHVNSEPRSRAHLYRQWGWMALNAGEPTTARRYALRALAMQPWSAAAWKLTACAVRGR